MQQRVLNQTSRQRSTTRWLGVVSHFSPARLKIKPMPFAFAAIVASALIVACDSVDEAGTMQISALTVLQFACLTGLLWGVYVGLASCFARAHGKKEVAHDVVHPVQFSINNHFTFRYVLFGACIMLLLWLPWLLALYPCSLARDTIISIGWFLNTVHGSTGLIYDHNPVLTVYIFGAVAWFGRYVLNNVGLTFFLLVVCQSFLSCLSFTLVVLLARKRFHASKGFCTAFFLFFTLCPLFPIWNNFLSKDTLFAPPFLFFLSAYIEVVFSRGTCLSSPKWSILLAASALMACLTKKLGAYIVIGSALPTAIWLWWVYERKIRVFIAPVSCFIVIFILLPKVLFPLGGIREGEKYEAYSVPLQQTARFVLEYPDEVSGEERQAIDTLLGYDDLAARYSFWIVDPVKFRIQEPTEAYSNWLKVWVAQGLRHPMSYIRAYFALERGFGSSQTTIGVQLDSSFLRDFDDLGVLGDCLASREAFPLARDVLEFYLWFEGLPIVEVLFRTCMYGVVLPFFVFGCSLSVRKGARLEAFSLILPVLLTLMGIWLSPISISVDGGRYLYPMVCMTPVLFLLSSHFISCSYSRLETPLI